MVALKLTERNCPKCAMRLRAQEAPFCPIHGFKAKDHMYLKCVTDGCGYGTCGGIRRRSREDEDEQSREVQGMRAGGGLGEGEGHGGVAAMRPIRADLHASEGPPGRHGRRAV
jgi:hypothetical protein